jgi:hypothetical protein
MRAAQRLIKSSYQPVCELSFHRQFHTEAFGDNSNDPSSSSCTLLPLVPPTAGWFEFNYTSIPASIPVSLLQHAILQLHEAEYSVALPLSQPIFLSIFGTELDPRRTLDYYQFDAGLSNARVLAALSGDDDERTGAPLQWRVHYSLDPYSNSQQLALFKSSTCISCRQIMAQVGCSSGF